MRKEIKVNWYDLKSIKRAERQKAIFENKGFKLIETISGLDTATMIYA